MPTLVGVEEMVVMVVLCEIVCMVYGISAWPVFLLPILFLLTDNPSKNSTDFPFINGRGYWPDPFRSIIPYWPELFRSINPYWPEQFRSIKPYWPEPFKLMVPCERVEKALKLWKLSKTPFPTMLYIKCLDSLDLSLLFEHPMRRANTLCNNNL